MRRRDIIGGIIVGSLVSIAYADTLVVSFPFTSDAQGFVATPAANVTMSWNTSALRSHLQTKNAPNRANRWDLATTWTGLGVPVGATITGVTAASMDSRVTAYTAAGSQHQSGATTLTDGATVITLSSARNFTATDPAPVTTAGVDMTGLSLPASNAINLRINNTLSTSNTNGATMTLFQDTLNFTITYTPAPAFTPVGPGHAIFPGRL